MAYAFVIQNDAFVSGSGTVQTISWAPNAGDSGISISKSAGTTGTWTCSDATDGALTKIGAEQNASGIRGVAFYKHVLSAGTRNLTSTRSANGTIRDVSYWRYTGLANSAPQTSIYRAQTQTLGLDAMTTTNLTPTSQPAMLFGFIMDDTNGLAITAGTGFNDRGPLANHTGGTTSDSEDLRLTSTTPVSATWTTLSGASTDFIFGVIFSEFVAGGIVGPLLGGHLINGGPLMGRLVH